MCKVNQAAQIASEAPVRCYARSVRLVLMGRRIMSIGLFAELTSSSPREAKLRQPLRPTRVKVSGAGSARALASRFVGGMTNLD